jgi:hypothetical protein
MAASNRIIPPVPPLYPSSGMRPQPLPTSFGANNPMFAAVMAGYSLGAGPYNPSDVAGVPSLTVPTNITGRTSDKFRQGFLGGLGGASQFQGVNTLLPVLPPATNRDTEWRMLESRGLVTGERLLTRFERPQNFNPGMGTDTWRDGTNVTWTMQNAGLLADVTSGQPGAITYPGLDRTDRDQQLQYQARYQGLDAMMTAPVIDCTGISTPTGMTLQGMQAASSKALTPGMRGGRRR